MKLRHSHFHEAGSAPAHTRTRVRPCPTSTPGSGCPTRTRQPGTLRSVFRKAQKRIQDPAKLKRLIHDLIDVEQWSQPSSHRTRCCSRAARGRRCADACCATSTCTRCCACPPASLDLAPVGLRPADQPALHAQAEPADARPPRRLRRLLRARPPARRARRDRALPLVRLRRAGRARQGEPRHHRAARRVPRGPRQPARPGGHRPRDRRGPHRRPGRVRGRGRSA